MPFNSFMIDKSRPFCSAVVVAAGSSQRMGGDKMMLELGGMPILARTLCAMDACECIDEIVVVTQQEKIMDVAKLCRDYGIEKATKIVCGGVNRSESSLAGVCEISTKAKLVAIHDGARPLVDEEIVRRAVHAASLHKAAAPAVPIKDTVKIVKGDVVEKTPNRATVKAVQTPQVFVPELIKAALTYVMQNELEVTDDCSAVELLDVPVRLTEGSDENIKITTPRDLMIAQMILDSRENGV